MAILGFVIICHCCCTYTSEALVNKQFNLYVTERYWTLIYYKDFFRENVLKSFFNLNSSRTRYKL